MGCKPYTVTNTQLCGTVRGGTLFPMPRRPRSRPCAPRSRVTFGELLELGSGYVVQPKIDGCYAAVRTDESGLAVAAVSSTGRPLECDILGSRISTGPALLVGELEAHTERGIQSASERGYQCLHVFDCLSVSGRDLSREPYRVRRDLLLRDRALLELDEGADKPWTVDRRGVVHDGSGRFSAAGIPQSWRRAPIVPQFHLEAAHSLWEQAMSGLLEGVVAVALDGTPSGRRSKVKCKPTDTLDCIVVSASPKRCTVRSFGRLFLVGCSGYPVAVGDVVEVRHEGWCRSGEPRFPRIVRRRFELGRSAA